MASRFWEMYILETLTERLQKSQISYEYHGYDSKLHLIVRPKSLSFREGTIPFVAIILRSTLTWNPSTH